MKILFIPIMLLATLSAGAQLYIDNATFYIDNGAVVTVQGDVFSNVDIQAAGTGKIRMAGTAAQNLNMNGFSIPNLEIDNPSANIVLTGAAKISGLLEFTNGKIQLGNFDLSMAPAATYTGAGAGKFAETNGTGKLKKEVTAAANHTLPIGNGTNYTPLQYQLTGGTYGAGAYVAARSVGSGHPNKHPRSTDYLTTYWEASKNGITGGTQNMVGTYLDPSNVTGTEADIRSMLWNGTTWALGTSQDVATNTVTAPLSAASMELYGMNKFILVSPKVFLQGAFNTTTGLMNDKLRNSGAYSPNTLPASNVLPTTDPYRNAPYNVSAFAHIGNPVVETLTSTAVLNDLANPNDQIVDWVFVELRNKTDNTTAPVVQTRSVLVQRDGDLVDIDGVSPVYFKNVDAGNNYVIAVKHRNHLGISTTPVSTLNLGLSTSTFDFTNTSNSGSIYGPGTNYTQAGSPAKILLWGGNIFLNTVTNYLGISTDRAQIITTMANPGNALSPARNITTVSDYQNYGIGDINFDRKVDYIGIGPDRAFLLSTIMAASPTNTRTQVLPN